MHNTLFFYEIIYRPIFNILEIFLKIFGGNLAFAIISLTILVRVSIRPLTKKTTNMQKGTGDMQTKIQELQEKYKDDPQKLYQETMKVMKKYGSGPLKGCLIMFVQIPIFLGLFYVIKEFALNQISPSTVYSFLFNRVSNYLSVDSVNTNFFGLNLLETGKDAGITGTIFAILAGILTYLQMKITNLVQPKQTALPTGQKTPDMSKMMNSMGLFMAMMIAFFVLNVQLGVGLYIFTTTLVGFIQYLTQYRNIIKIKLSKDKNQIFKK